MTFDREIYDEWADWSGIENEDLKHSLQEHANGVTIKPSEKIWCWQLIMR